MVTEFKAFENCVADKFDSLIDIMFQPGYENIRKLIVEEFNRQEEDLHYGVDYLFSIKHREDIITCLQGGMTIEELRDLLSEYEEYKDNANSLEQVCEFFHFGENYPKASLLSPKQIVKYLKGYTIDIVHIMLLYPHETNKELYTLLLEDIQ